MELRFASEGWHLRWRTPSTDEFNLIREDFKDRVPLEERYWDPLAFEGKGGWWVAYGWLQEVSDLFDNYQQARDQLEQPFWERYEQQLQEARARAEQEYRRQEREREHGRKAQKEQGKQHRQQKNTEQQKSTQQPVKKPETLAEALIILKLSPSR